jgi:hypothetical protein
MEALARQFHQLPPEQKRSVHFTLCYRALEMWRSYAKVHGRIGYPESVCGTVQVVDKSLPAEAFHSAALGRDTAKVGKRYLEPITAMQEYDLEFPEHIQYAYYAIYNLFEKYVERTDIDDWLIVNQALSSETRTDLWAVLLREAIDESV